MGCAVSVHDLPGDAAPIGAASKAAGPPSPTADSKTTGVKRDGKGAAVGGSAADTLPLLSGWACDHHGTGRHSIFGSYRVKSEGSDGNGLIKRLVDAIEKRGKEDAGDAVTVFYDKQCLNSGESWEMGLKNGLEGASLVMPLVSAVALQGMIEHAATRRDNLLMEWETALERQFLGKCLVLPIFVQDVGTNGKPRHVDYIESSYPDTPHFLSGISIKTTIVALLKIQGVKLTLDRSGAPDPAQLAEAVRNVLSLLGSQELRTMRHRAQQEYQDERGRKALVWKRVEAIIGGNDVIGRGASSIVYRGKLIPTEPDESDPPVAVKALKAEAVAASKQFTTELEIMKGLQVRSQCVFALSPLFSTDVCVSAADARAFASDVCMLLRVFVTDACALTIDVCRVRGTNYAKPSASSSIASAPARGHPVLIFINSGWAIQGPEVHDSGPEQRKQRVFRRLFF